jgi:hypothetical protein
MAHTPRDWIPGEVLTAALLEDLETRLAAYTDSVGGGGGGGSSNGVIYVPAGTGNSTTDTSNIVGALNSGGEDSVVIFHALNSGQAVIKPGQHVYGRKSRITLNGNGWAFRYTAEGGTRPSYKGDSGRIGEMQILDGSNGTNSGAEALRIEDSWGFLVNDVTIGSEVGSNGRFTAGTGIHFLNNTADGFVEGAVLREVRSHYSGTGVKYRRGGGTNSFNGHVWDRLLVNVNPGQTGIDFGSDGTDAFLYNGRLNAVLWQENGAGSIGVRCGPNFKVPASTFAHIVGEGFGGTARTFFKMDASGGVNGGNWFVPSGIMGVWRDSGFVSDYNGGNRCSAIAYIEDVASSSGMPYVHAELWAETSVPTATDVALDFDGYRRRTHGAMWSSGQPTRLVAPAPGRYRLIGTVEWAGNANGVRFLRAQRTRAVGGSTANVARSSDAAHAATSDQRQLLAGDFELYQGDYIEIIALQTSGSTLAIRNSDEYSAEFTLEWVCPLAG